MTVDLSKRNEARINILKDVYANALTLLTQTANLFSHQETR